MLREPLRVALVSGPAGASLSQHPPPSLPLFPPPHPPLLPPSSSILSLVNFTIARHTPAHVATVMQCAVFPGMIPVFGLFLILLEWYGMGGIYGMRAKFDSFD